MPHINLKVGVWAGVLPPMLAPGMGDEDNRGVVGWEVSGNPRWVGEG